MTRSISLIIAAGLASAAMPSLAQDGRYDRVAPDEAVIQAADDAEAAAAEASLPYQEERAVPRALQHDEAYSISADDQYSNDNYAHRYPQRATGHHALPSAPGETRLGYSMDEREAWLDQCRYQYSVSYDDDRGGDSGLIGGLLGAVVGGVGGNRIGGRGDRLAGTLIGAGVGGVAGAVIGSVIGNSRRHDRDRRQADAMDECEAYLLRYERSALSGGGYALAYAPVAYAPVMMVRVPIQRRAHVHDESCYEVVEEWVEEAPARRVTRTVRRRAPARAPSKLRPIK